MKISFFLINQWKIRYFILLISVGIYSLNSTAQINNKDHLTNLLNDSLLVKSFVGVSIRNTTTNAIVYERNGNLSFTPASNLKLLTSAAALELLGPEYRFTTRAYYSDSIMNNSLKGVLLIKGSGDPTLGSDKMVGNASYQQLITNIVKELKLKGVNRFLGIITIDPTHFEYNPIPMDYTWADIGNYYGAGSFGLNLNENQTVIAFKPASIVGRGASVQSITPWDTSWTFNNLVKTGASNSGDKSVIYSSPYNNIYFAEGTIPMGSSFFVKASINDPAKLFARLLIAEMGKQGMVFNGTVNVLQPNDTKINLSSLKLLFTHTSPVLKDIITQTNLVSNNLYAECLLKEISFKQTGIGSTQNGINELKKYLSNKKVDTIGMVLRDGSGMSPFNSISPNQFTQILVANVANGVFMNCIPIAGLQGTVSHICKGSDGKIRVKSGTMNGVTCYSGYVQGNSGKRYAVSLMVNKHEAKNRQIQRVLSAVLMDIMINN